MKLEELGLNRNLIKDGTVDTVYDPTSETDSVVIKSLTNATDKTSVQSGATTFDVSQTTDALKNKILQDCILNGTLNIYAPFSGGFLESGYIEPYVTVNGRGINMTTSDGGSSIFITEATSHWNAGINAGTVSMEMLLDSTHKDIIFSGGLLVLPQFATADLSGLTITNGSMYYDTTLNKIMAYIAGAWKTLSYT